MSELDRLISGLDHDGLVRYVDACCAPRDWHEFLHVRDRCRIANDSGRQMWPITTLANYRLALHAPAEFAVASLEESNTNFLFGPLSEVIAQAHRWEDLAALLPTDHVADVIAHECAIRGNEVSAIGALQVFDIPHTLQEWEPHYSTPKYSDNGVEHDPPVIASEMHDVEVATTARIVEDRDATSALRAIVEPWLTTSNGRAEIAGAEGGISEALAAIRVTRARATRINSAHALNLLAWAGASGGAHGRRRGLASGRYSTWWLLVALAGLGDEWPIETREVGAIANEFHWWSWDAYEPNSGWRLQIAIEDPIDNLTWIINAVDTAI